MKPRPRFSFTSLFCFTARCWGGGEFRDSWGVWGVFLVFLIFWNFVFLIYFLCSAFSIA